VKKKHEKLKVDLLLSLDYISVNDTRYCLMKNCCLKRISIAKYHGGPAYSQGVDNYIQFKTGDQRIKIFFQLETPSHKVNLRSIMRLLFLNDRIDLRYIQNLLRHERSKTTEIYTHITTKGFNQIISPLDKLEI
jgi:hypothetical protein